MEGEIIFNKIKGYKQFLGILLLICISLILSTNAVSAATGHISIDTMTSNSPVTENIDMPSSTVSDPYNTRTGESYVTIQEAIDAALPGDTIIVEAGTYNENIIVNKALTITGQGTVIIKPSIPESGDIIGIKITEDAIGTRISGLIVQGPNINSDIWTGFGILDLANDSELSYNQIKDFWIGINIVADNVFADSNTILNSVYAAVDASGNDNNISRNIITNVICDAVRIEEGTGNQVVDNVITAGYSYLVGNGIVDFDPTAIIDNNIINGFSKTEVGSGIVVIGSVDNVNNQYVQVINNKISDCYNGIIFSGISNSNIVNNIITGNTIYDLTFGIIISPLYYSHLDEPTEILVPSKDNIIIQNTINNAGMIGIDIRDSGNNMITKNKITNCAQAGIGIGDTYFQTSSTQSNLISENIIKGNHNGIQMNGVTYTIITKNSIYDSYNSGIWLSNCANTLITSNNIYNNGVGINIKESTGLVALDENPDEIYFEDSFPFTEGNIVKFNRIVDNYVDLANYSSSLVDAVNNWWGSNNEPTTAEIDDLGVASPAQIMGHTLEGSFNVDYDPWLVLSFSANPKKVAKGSYTILKASLNGNSDGQLLVTGLDGVPVYFTADVGSIKALDSLARKFVPKTVNGIAQAKLNIPTNTKKKQSIATVTVDQQKLVLNIPILGNFIHQFPVKF